MILENIRYLVTQNRERDVIENADVRVVEDRIAEVGRNLSHPDEHRIDCSDRIVMPGLINAHTHVPMALFRGISDNKNLQDWLHEDIFPAEEKMDGEDVYLGSLLGTTEMLESGTTCFNEMYFKTDRIAEAVEDTGIRAVLARGVMDIEESIDEQLEKATLFVENYRDHERINTAIAPHAIYTCSKDLLRLSKKYAEAYNVPYHIHVSETVKENKDSREEHGKTPVEYLESEGLLDSSVVTAHCTWLTERDRNILSERDVSVAHNPAANLKLGSGIADLNRMKEAGINTGLGTDGSASNNSLNMFQEMKLAGLLHKRNDPTEITEQDILDMATVNSAKALDMEEEIGSIEEGKKADLVMIDIEDVSMNPIYGDRGLISNLVYSFNGDVSEVLVDGQLVVENGRCTEVNHEKIVEAVNERVEKFG